MMKRMTTMLLVVAIAVWLAALPAGAHVHVAENAHQGSGQELANGQNHPRFQEGNEDGLRISCEGTLEPEDSGPAGYGLETAHHGPDAGTPGKADGCYAVVGNPVDNNPAID